MNVRTRICIYKYYPFRQYKLLRQSRYDCYVRFNVFYFFVKHELCEQCAFESLLYIIVCTCYIARA